MQIELIEQGCGFFLERPQFGAVDIVFDGLGKIDLSQRLTDDRRQRFGAAFQRPVEVPLEAADEGREDLFGRALLIRCIDHSPWTGERSGAADDAVEMFAELVVMLELVTVKILQQEAAALVLFQRRDGVGHLCFRLVEEELHDQAAVVGQKPLCEADVAHRAQKFHLILVRMMHQLPVKAVVEDADHAMCREGLEEPPEHGVLFVHVGGIVKLGQVVIAWVELTH